MDAIATVGHGTLAADALVALLRGAGVDVVVDVRRFPGSRRSPHLAGGAMAAWLADAGLAYEWLPDLGGRRKPDPASRNIGLRHPQLRAYADHMASSEFARGVDFLAAVATGRSAAVLCAEAVWWRCHRRLLADHLVLVTGTPVTHLFHDGRLAPHPPAPEARVDGSVVVYDRVDGPGEPDHP